MNAWCPTCKKTRKVNSLDRSPANWRCKCGTFLVAPSKAAKASTSSAKSRKPIRRGRSKKPVMRPEVREAMVLWARAGICAVCGKEACQPVQGHHVLEQRWLRERARLLKIDVVPLLEDRRGWLRAGEPCHMRHHYAPNGRIPRLVLVENCPEVFAFAAELGLSQRLNDAYPDVAQAAA